MTSLTDIEKAREWVRNSPVCQCLECEDLRRIDETIRASLDFHAKWLKLRETHKFVEISPSMVVQQFGNDAIKEFVLTEPKPTAYSAPVFRAMINASKDPLEDCFT